MAYSVTSNYYSNRQLMSYDRNKFPYRVVIGVRGFGKTYAMQNMLCNFYHKVKNVESNVSNVDDLFIWLRLTDSALSNMRDNILDPKLQKKHNITPRMVQKDKYYEIYFNDRLMGHAMSLANSPYYKGGIWAWQRYKYVIMDEFQRERRERRTFDIVYNLRSLLESVTRFTTRINEGYDYPYVIFMGNTVDEATDLLYAFDFMPLKYGIYKLKKKYAIIEYAEDSEAYKRLQRKNPLRVLSGGDDFTFGERKLEMKDNILDWRNTGGMRYVAHLQITEYIRFEVWLIKRGSLYITKGHPTAKYQNKVFTLHRLAANRGTYYSIEFHKLIRSNFENNSIYFDKRITAVIFNQNII